MYTAQERAIQTERWKKFVQRTKVLIREAKSWGLKEVERMCSCAHFQGISSEAMKYLKCLGYTTFPSWWYQDLSVLPVMITAEEEMGLEEPRMGSLELYTLHPSVLQSIIDGEETDDPIMSYFPFTAIEKEYAKIGLGLDRYSFCSVKEEHVVEVDDLFGDSTEWLNSLGITEGIDCQDVEDDDFCAIESWTDFYIVSGRQVTLASTPEMVSQLTVEGVSILEPLPYEDFVNEVDQETAAERAFDSEIFCSPIISIVPEGKLFGPEGNRVPVVGFLRKRGKKWYSEMLRSPIVPKAYCTYPWKEAFKECPHPTRRSMLIMSWSEDGGDPNLVLYSKGPVLTAFFKYVSWENCDQGTGEYRNPVTQPKHWKIDGNYSKISVGKKTVTFSLDAEFKQRSPFGGSDYIERQLTFLMYPSFNFRYLGSNRIRWCLPRRIQDLPHDLVMDVNGSYGLVMGGKDLLISLNGFPDEIQRLVLLFFSFEMVTRVPRPIQGTNRSISAYQLMRNPRCRSYMEWRDDPDRGVVCNVEKHCGLRSSSYYEFEGADSWEKVLSALSVEKRYDGDPPMGSSFIGLDGTIIPVEGSKRKRFLSSDWDDGLPPVIFDDGEDNMVEEGIELDLGLPEVTDEAELDTDEALALFCSLDDSMNM